VNAVVKLEVNVELSPAQLAKAFCDMDDEAQAQFFIECARLAEGWRASASDPTILGPDWQWYTVGRHLRTCACSTEEARDMVRGIAEGISGDIDSLRRETGAS
jgi:hypothetical protein